MKVELELELEDAPGALITALVPISEHGGNIHNIFHNREDTGRKLVPVKITFDIESESALGEIERGLREKKIRVKRIGRITKKHSTDMILTGHVIDTDIKDTLDRVNNRQAKVTQLDVKMADPKQPSSVYLRIESENMENHKKATAALLEIAKEKNLQVIEPL